MDDVICWFHKGTLDSRLFEVGIRIDLTLNAFMFLGFLVWNKIKGKGMRVKKLDLCKATPTNLRDKCWIVKFKPIFALPSTVLQLDKDGAIFNGFTKDVLLHNTTINSINAYR